MSKDRKGLAALLFCISILLSQNAQAKAVSSFNGLTQYAAAFGTSEAITDETYERYHFDAVGGQFEITTYRYSGAVAVPDPGDFWKLEVSRSGTTLASALLIYDAGTNCLLLNGSSPLYCNFAIPPGEYGWNRFTVDIAWNFKCAPTTEYVISASEPTANSHWPVRPTRFRPRFLALLTPATMRPSLPGDNYSPRNRLLPVEGDTSPLRAIVSDDLGCLQALSEPEVTLEMRVTPNTGGHAHFTSETEPGTGRFVQSDGSPDPRGTSTEISDHPDAYGHVLAYYEAGEQGTGETLVATAEIPFVSPKDPEWEVTEEKTFNVKVPGLVEAPASSADYEFIYGGGCPHNPTARWMTTEMSAKVAALSSWYRTEFGAPLSLNDASLPFGGFFDNKMNDGGGRTARCHGSHRRGIDIDINGVDRGGVNVRTALVGKATRLDVITQRADMLWLEKIPEGYSVHFRNRTHQ